MPHQNLALAPQSTLDDAVFKIIGEAPIPQFNIASTQIDGGEHEALELHRLVKRLISISKGRKRKKVDLPLYTYTHWRQNGRSFDRIHYFLAVLNPLSERIESELRRYFGPEIRDNAHGRHYDEIYVNIRYVKISPTAVEYVGIGAPWQMRHNCANFIFGHIPKNR